MQHLSAAPASPSALVDGVSTDLERVLLKLLAKNLTERFGFADEVAASLAQLSDDVSRIAEFPPPRPYLYRPRFVGRAELVEQLSSLRDCALAGSGAFVLIGGESGVGKTRLALEMTRVLPSAQLRVVTSELFTLSVENAGAAVGPAPLQALRPLLQAVADRCQEGGESVTERLLGSRRSVLAPYESALAHVPASEPMTPPISLTVEGARQRLFKCLSETLAAFAREHPVILVLDDLGWADELSLDYLRSLSAEYLNCTAIFILGTYRTEVAGDAVRSLCQLAHVKTLILPRLEDDAVASMIGDMLAMPDQRQRFVTFVTSQAEGNPFFVTEHVRAAVMERVLYRDQKNAWRLQEEGPGVEQRYESISLPRSLRELIDDRLRRLTPAARQVSLAAAVLGREADLEVLQNVAALPESVAVRAIDELLRRQVLEQPSAGRVRFAHDKLREAAYAQLPADQVTALHARAATTFEALSRHHAEPSGHWAALGHHFATAKLAEPAARYLRLAADHARSTYANGDAIRLYQEAIRWRRLVEADDVVPSRRAMVELFEASADVLASVGRRDEARSAYLEALDFLPDSGRTEAARLHRKVGKTLEIEHRHADALLSYESAKAFLDVDPLAAHAAVQTEWIQVRIDQLWVYYFLNRTSDMDTLIQALEPVVSGQAAPIQRARFLRTYWMRNLRRDRYRANDETVDVARRALLAAKESNDHDQLCLDQFGLGFVLLFHQVPDDACIELQRALELATRVGDVSRQARCVAYLTVGRRMQGHDAAVRDCVRLGENIASQSRAPEYLATAQANHAWLAFREHDTETATREARAALEVWRKLSLVWPLQWLALLPLLQSTLADGNVEEALKCAADLLDTTQQQLPSATTTSLGDAVTLWRAGRVAEARDSLDDGVRRLEGTVYA